MAGRCDRRIPRGPWEERRGLRRNLPPQARNPCAQNRPLTPALIVVPLMMVVCIWLRTPR